MIAWERCTHIGLRFQKWNTKNRTAHFISKETSAYYILNFILLLWIKQISNKQDHSIVVRSEYTVKYVELQEYKITTDIHGKPAAVWDVRFKCKQIGWNRRDSQSDSHVDRMPD